MTNKFTVGERVVAGDVQYRVIDIREGADDRDGLRYDLREIYGDGELTDVPECLIRPYNGEDAEREDAVADGYEKVVRRFHQ